MTKTERSAKNLEEVKELNLIRVLKLIHKMEVCSRSQLAAMSGLKQSTITNIVNRLIEYGVVRETGSFEGKKGRRSIGITLETERYQVIGVRLTRTDFSVGLFSIDGRPEQTENRQIRPEQPVEQILSDIEETIRALMACAPHKVVAVGMAVPGPYLANSGRVLLITGARKWEKVNFKKQLAEKFSIPFYIEHDANAGVLAEWWYGKRRLEEKTYLYIAAGFGIGAGIIINGQVFHGSMGIAGEIGHMTIDCEGKPCACGNRGCLEQYASSAAVCEEIERQIKEGKPCSLKSGFAFAEAIQAYRSGDALVRDAFLKSAAYLGIGVASMIYAYNPDLVIVGDEMTLAGEEYLEQLRRTVRERVLPEIYQGTEIYSCSFPQDPAFIGAAALALEESFQQPSRLLSILEEA